MYAQYGKILSGSWCHATPSTVVGSEYIHAHILNNYSHNIHMTENFSTEVNFLRQLRSEINKFLLIFIIAEQEARPLLRPYPPPHTLLLIELYVYLKLAFTIM